MNEAIKQAIEAMTLALNSHGRALMTDPPQDSWKYNRCSDKLNEAIAALRAQPDHSELVKKLRGIHAEDWVSTSRIASKAADALEGL